MNTVCPYCEKQLTYHDWFGKDMMRNPKKSGDMYICKNEECNYYEECFYTKNNSDELFEGRPC